MILSKVLSTPHPPLHPLLSPPQARIYESLPYNHELLRSFSAYLSSQGVDARGFEASLSSQLGHFTSSLSSFLLCLFFCRFSALFSSSLISSQVPPSQIQPLPPWTPNLILHLTLALIPTPLIHPSLPRVDLHQRDPGVANSC